jgi:hypothetical protein
MVDYRGSRPVEPGICLASTTAGVYNLRDVQRACKSRFVEGLGSSPAVPATVERSGFYVVGEYAR